MDRSLATVTLSQSDDVKLAKTGTIAAVGAAGGIAGYFGRSTAAKLGVEAWFANVDAGILNKAEIAFL